MASPPRSSSAKGGQVRRGGLRRGRGRGRAASCTHARERETRGEGQRDTRHTHRLADHDEVTTTTTTARDAALLTTFPLLPYSTTSPPLLASIVDEYCAGLPFSSLALLFSLSTAHEAHSKVGVAIPSIQAAWYISKFEVDRPFFQLDSICVISSAHTIFAPSPPSPHLHHQSTNTTVRLYRIQSAAYPRRTSY